MDTLNDLLTGRYGVPCLSLYQDNRHIEAEGGDAEVAEWLDDIGGLALRNSGQVVIVPAARMPTCAAASTVADMPTASAYRAVPVRRKKTPPRRPPPPIHLPDRNRKPPRRAPRRRTRGENARRSQVALRGRRS